VTIHRRAPKTRLVHLHNFDVILTGARRN